jgi:hypothetical protein
MKHDFYPTCPNCSNQVYVDFDKLNEPVVCDNCNTVLNEPQIKLLILNDFSCLERGINFQKYHSVEYKLNVSRCIETFDPDNANFRSEITHKYSIAKKYAAHSLQDCLTYINPFVRTLSNVNIFSIQRTENEKYQLDNILNNVIIQPIIDLLPLRLMEKDTDSNSIQIVKDVNFGTDTSELNVNILFTMVLYV